MKILIFGVGGIGGFLGSYLLETGAEITFIARGKRLQYLEKEGLILESKIKNIYQKRINVKETVEPNDEYDFILSTVKLYDFDNFISQIQTLKKKDFIVLPFQNGTYSEEKIINKFGIDKVSGSVAQISSYINMEQKIIHVGKLATFLTGSLNQKNSKRIREFCSLCISVGLDFRYKENILNKIWEKFIFLSAYSGMTTMYNKTIGEIFENKILKEKFITAMKETQILAEKLNIEFKDDPINFWLDKIENMPYKMTSSMHEDSKKKKKLEIQWLSGSIVRNCKKLNLKCKLHKEFVEKIR
mgnify:CR=1 FL=1